MECTKRFLVLVIIAIVFAITSIAILSVGIHKRKSAIEVDCTSDAQKLTEFLTRVQNAFYEENPNKVGYKPDSVVDDIKSTFRPYDCRPAAIKRQTDRALKLSREAEKLDIKEDNLSVREQKALAQVKHYLKTIFGSPFDANYYIGDWMLGPNNFCWQAICYIGHDFSAHYNTRWYGFQPKTTPDFEYLLDIITEYGKSIIQYVENMKLGVKTGMVRSQEQCKAGIDAMKGRFPKIVDEKEQGILNETFIFEVRKPDYLAKLNNADKQAWENQKGKSMAVSLDEHLVENLGKPIHTLLRYLIDEHYTHCTPSAAHSGLATLPLSYIWTNGTEDLSKPTTKRLPTGEILDGKKAYEAIVPYFTTVDMSPDEIYALGERQLKALFPRAISIAKKFTNLSNDAQAALQFKSNFLDSPTSSFNSTPIPDNETSEDAHRKCKDLPSAKQYCPVRYNAMMSWFDYVQTILAKLDPMTIKFFYFTGNNDTTPNCPLKIQAKFNPSSGSQSYSGAGKFCSRPCYYMLPFWLTPPGPRWNAISVAGHEGRPGHHTQVQGFSEHFSGNSGGKHDIIDWLNSETYYTAFTEGWALYAENPILAQGTDVYADEPLQEYGMLKWQIWRALRLMVDSGLHYKGMKRQEALEMFEKYAWDTSDKAIKDVTRYQSSPGQATAYMIGQLAIWRLRNETILKFKENKIEFSEKEFHFYLLSQGSAPLSYLESFMRKFISCKINNKQDMCVNVLNPLKTNKPQSSSSGKMTQKPVEPRPFHEHYE